MVLYGLEETGGEAKVGNHKSLRNNKKKKKKKEVEAAEDLLDSKLFDNFFWG